MAAGNPTLPAIDDAEAAGLQDTLNEGTGIKYKPHGVTPEDTPKHATHITMSEHRFMTLMARAATGQVVDLNGRNIGVFAINYKRGANLYSFPGETSFTLDANEDHYIYLDADETLKISHTDFPADSFHLAYAETSADDITALKDHRWDNADVGGTNNWSAVAATTDVDLNDKLLKDAKGIDFSAPSELTISSGSITPTQFHHTVDTEGEAASDDLTTITPTAGKVAWLLLRPENAARVVTIKSTDNINLRDGDFVMDDADSLILLMQTSDTEWTEVSRNRNTLLTLTATLDANGQNFKDVGCFNFNAPTQKTISGGQITIDQSVHSVKVESGDEDDLDTILGGVGTSDLLLLTGTGDGTVHVKHGTGNLYLAAEVDYDLIWNKPVSGAGNWLLLLKSTLGWMEIGRSLHSIEELVGTARSIPYPIQFTIPGALAAGAQKWHFHCPYQIVIVNATGYVDGVPGGGSCIVDILDDGESIFADDSERISIPDAAHQDTSATKNKVVGAGSILSCEIKSTGGSPNGADDLTASLNCHVAPESEP